MNRDNRNNGYNGNQQHPNGQLPRSRDEQPQQQPAHQQSLDTERRYFDIISDTRAVRKKVAFCQYNPVHIIDSNRIDEHEKTCPDKELFSS